MFGQRDVPEPGGVVVPEPVSPVIATPGELRLRGHRLEFAGVRPETDVASADGNSLPRGKRLHLAAAVAVRSVDPAIKSPLESVEAMLLVAGRKPGEQHFPHVSPTVAIRVLRVNQIGSRSDESALAPRHHAGREGHSFEERDGLVVSPVAVGILDHFHHAARLAFAIQTQRIVPHLHDP